ncbi:hypothetical protein ABEB36_014414 [Hypothenemus hampei]|uniref:Protein lin-37 homolog n=1 Tax=Hypothenemus hampei TaxID=57062 RepID=A0ABD1E2L8_HYPHA
MTKKRRLSSSPVKIEIKEENVGNDYLLAKGRLKGVLRQLAEKSSDEESVSSDDGYSRRRRSDKKRRNQLVPAPYHHTYVMKLYDRSVDLARFEEDTPLYPLCRAWMENQPKNPQKLIKRRTSSPEPGYSVRWSDSAVNVKRLPPPSNEFDTRVPSPLPDQLSQNKSNINLNYEEHPPVDKDILVRNHLQRWAKVKKQWMEMAAKNEQRYADSFRILETIYNKAQDHIE